MIAASRSGFRPSGASRSSSSCRHTDIATSTLLNRGERLRFDAGDAADRAREHLPGAALRGQHPAPLRRQTIEPPPALAGFLRPTPLDPFALLEAIEQGIERRGIEPQRAVGSRLDQLADVVAVPRPVLDQGENEQFSAALF